MAGSGEQPPVSVRYANLKKSFRLGVRPLLTAVSKEDVHKAFSSFTNAERESLYHMFIQVIKSLHENIEEEFESICQETKVGTILDAVEQLVEEQSLDILSADEMNMGEIKDKLSKAKKDEICHLRSLLEKAEEQNNIKKAHIEFLRKRQDLSVGEDAVGKLKSWNTDFERFLGN